MDAFERATYNTDDVDRNVGTYRAADQSVDEDEAYALSSAASRPRLPSDADRIQMTYGATDVPILELDGGIAESSADPAYVLDYYGDMDGENMRTSSF